MYDFDSGCTDTGLELETLETVAFRVDEEVVALCTDGSVRVLVSLELEITPVLWIGGATSPIGITEEFKGVGELLPKDASLALEVGEELPDSTLSEPEVSNSDSDLSE